MFIRRNAMKSIKQFVKKVLGITDLEADLVEAKRNIVIAQGRITEVEEIRKYIQVGVDVHPKTDSWAVICLAGKKDYVNFFRLRDADIREISFFLRRFDRQNTTVDMYGSLPKDIMYEKH